MEAVVLSFQTVFPSDLPLISQQVYQGYFILNTSLYWKPEVSTRVNLWNGQLHGSSNGARKIRDTIVDY